MLLPNLSVPPSLFYAYLVSLITALATAPVVIRWYQKMGWVDDPKVKKHVKNTHTRAVPRGGGLVVFVAIFVTSLLFLSFSQKLAGILIGASLLAFIGWLDDIYDIHPLVRFGVNILAALAVIMSGVGIAFISNPFSDGVIHLNAPQINYFFLGKERSIWVVSDLLALIFIVWNMNIVDWAKGVAGQLPGFVAISAAFIALLALRFASGDFSQLSVATLALIVSGAYLGLLFFNWYPQKMMPGYGAGSLAGYFLAVLAILSGAKVATTLMVLAIPTADAVFTITRRILAGKAPYWGDRGHLHHKLMDVLGWSQKRVAVFYWITSFFLGFISLFLNSFWKMVVLVVVFFLVFGFLIWVKLAKIKSTGNEVSSSQATKK